LLIAQVSSIMRRTVQGHIVTTALNDLGSKAGELLKARGERVAVAESSSGGLISAALLAVPGASAYFISGGVIYTGRALNTLLGVTREDFGARGLRSSSEPYALFLAERIRLQARVDWGVAETGAAGPTGNSYGDPPGHSCIAVVGPGERKIARTVRTGRDDRVANMWAFADAALALLVAELTAQ
jgi:nicotinamide-nucleotide amidase